MILLATLVLIIGIGGFYLLGQQQVQDVAGTVEEVTIAIGTGPVVSSVHIAVVKDFFKDEGLQVTIQQHTSGRAAFKAVIDGEADIATAAETPIMHAVLNGEKIAILSTIETSDENKVLVGRKDKGISTPQDLNDKKIGVTFGSNAEFFLDLFLIRNGISRDTIEIVDLRGDEIFHALVRGEVDAVSTWNPFVLMLQKELGDNGVLFFGEGIYEESFNIVAKQDFVQKNPEAIKKVIQGLVKAEEFIEKNQNESIKIIADILGTEEASLREVWDIYDFQTRLDQSLILTLEDESRWAIGKNLTTATEVPNYLDFIYLDALVAVKPEAVTIIR